SLWFTPFLKARLAGAAGDRQGTIDNLRKSVEAGAAGNYTTDLLPEFAEYRDDPEVAPLLETMAQRRQEFARAIADGS
ncbi:MAG: hypothetical protein PVF61_05915, partial [Gammaproteobacteria bacterium]